MGWWQHKGSFFYFNRGYLHLKYDATADTTDYCECPPESFDPDVDTASNRCELTLNRCETAEMLDPCGRENPLFPSGSTLAHAVYQVADSVGLGVHAQAFEIVFDSIFVIFDNNVNVIYRVGGETYDTLVKGTFYTHSASPSSSYASVVLQDSVTVSANGISTICSMDFYGLFLGIEDA